MKVKEMKRLITFSVIFIIMTRANLYAFTVDKEGNHKIFGVVQVIYNYDFKAEEISNAFSFGKTSFGIKGTIKKPLGYCLQISLDPREFTYKAYDAYGRLNFSFGEIRIDQFKPPFSMERLISFPKRDFVHNAIATGLVSSRDIGIGFFGNFPFFECNCAIINGEGLNKREENSHKDIIIRIAPRYSAFKVSSAAYIGETGPDSLLT